MKKILHILLVFLRGASFQIIIKKLAIQFLKSDLKCFCEVKCNVSRASL